MTATLALSPDSQVLALACSGITGAGSERPLSAKDWSQLRHTIHDSEIGRPGNLLGLRADEIQTVLNISDSAASRLHALLSRGVQFAIELERLANRGIWLITFADDAYPAQLRRRLGDQAPPVLFGSGPSHLLTRRGLAIIGSRDADESALQFASDLAERAAAQSFAVVSGAARGVDSTAMHAALESGGHAVGVTADPLERTIRRKDLRNSLELGSLCLITPYHPAARWQVGNAMRRNRLIYALAEAAVVVATAPRSGGTWSGAIEDLRSQWVPLWVRDDGSPGAAALAAEGAQTLRADQLIGMRIAVLTASKVEKLRGSLLDDETTSHASDESAVHADPDVAKPLPTMRFRLSGLASPNT